MLPGVEEAWDWWNDWNIRGVDFEAGINTQTYKYYIDFAASTESKREFQKTQGFNVNLKSMNSLRKTSLQGKMNLKLQSKLYAGQMQVTLKTRTSGGSAE